MNMSRSVQRQLLGAGLIRAVTAVATGPDATPGTIRVCQELDRLAGDTTDFAMVGNRKNECGQWILDAKARRQRDASLHALIREIGKQYAETVDPRDFLTAAMRWIEDLRDQLPEEPDARRNTWAVIASGLQCIYDFYDPKWQAHYAMDAGAERGGDFQRVTGVW